VIVAVANLKGGTGKTTTTFHVARYFAGQGRTTLAVDLDDQSNLTSLLIHDLAKENNIVQLFSSKSDPPAPVPVGLNLDLIGADDTLSEYESGPEYERSFRLRELLSTLNYDVVVCDTPTHMGLSVTNALIAADCALIPVRPDRFNKDAMTRLFSRIVFVREHGNPRLRIAGMVLNAVQQQTTYAKAFAPMLRDTYDAAVFETVIPSSIRVTQALEESKPVWELAPTEKVSVAWKSFLGELERTLWDT
jgi:chromosome partitioning protein